MTLPLITRTLLAGGVGRARDRRGVRLEHARARSSAWRRRAGAAAADRPQGDAGRRGGASTWASASLLLVRARPRRQAVAPARPRPRCWRPRCSSCRGGVGVPSRPNVLASGVYRTGGCRAAGRAGDDVLSRRAHGDRDGARAHGRRIVSLATNGKPDASLTPGLVSSAATRSRRRPRSIGDAADADAAPARHPGPCAAGANGGDHRAGLGHVVAPAARQPAPRELVTIEIEPQMIEGSRVFYPGQPAGLRRPALDDRHRRRQVLLRLGAPAVRPHHVGAVESLGERGVRALHRRVLRPHAPAT